MKAHELAKTLLAGPDKDIMILDGFNSGGIPRTINLGPCDHIITEADANEAADCEGSIGKEVLVIGYGCY